ncbi:hypothetical protein JTB14_006952 [Gonioctena quinquepunctata]|nr:hypothetical protein JTB14_006952 [Gonioctena quinquepunctata]
MKSECRFKRKNVGRLREDRKKGAHVMVEEEGEIAFIASANNITSTTTQEEIEFIADSGATDHLINDEVYFNGGAVDLEKPIRINVAKEGESLIATKVGTITTTTCKLENVLFVPGLRCNLLSISRCKSAGLCVKFEKSKIECSDTTEVLTE